MNNLYTVVTKKDGNWWVGWIIEIPGVNCQERTHKKLLESLKVTLKEALEFNRHKAEIILGGIILHWIRDQQFQGISPFLFDKLNSYIIARCFYDFVGHNDGFDESNPYSK